MNEKVVETHCMNLIFQKESEYDDRMLGILRKRSQIGRS